MKVNTLRIYIYIIGFICFCAFAAVRIPRFYNLLIKDKVIPEYWENTEYGELYYFNYIRHFREELPPTDIKYRFKSKHPDLSEAEILTFGDSFFDFARMTTFPERLGDTLNKKVYYARYDYPLQYLGERGYVNYQSRILIYETAERYIANRFTSPHVTSNSMDSRSGIRKKAADFRDLVFLSEGEMRYSMLLSRSYFTKDIYSFIATLKFDAFGYIPSTTPVYALDQKDPWLFYHEEVNNDSTSFYYRYTDEEISTYCDNIADLMVKLKNEYNLDMVFLPIPSKYTIYHKFINNDAYNNFLPEIYKGLADRGVPFINLYNDYVSSEEVLYYGTDTHWNRKGLDIALSRTVNAINNMRPDYIALDSINPNNQ